MKKELKEKPNLVDYQKTYQAFQWEEAFEELDWFADGRLNAAYNAVDRHAQTNPDKIALYWQGAEGEKETYTFGDLSRLSNQFAQVLKDLGIQKGDRVFIFLPRVPQLYISFLGILKTGAIAGTLFAAFGHQGLLDRLKNSGAKILITNQELKKRVDKIRKKLPKLEKIFVIEDEWEKVHQAAKEFPIAKMKPNEGAFMLYTSGTTGKPKGILHTHRAILLEHMTAKWVLDLKKKDVFWCTADPGWVTGVAYGILGSWSNGTSNVVFQGRFDPEVWYQIIQEYRVSVWYTAPTAIRMLEAAGEALVKKYDFSSLRYLTSVGEPLNPEPIRWGKKVFGLPFHDNWWQTETGGILIANYPALPIKPGSMGKPIPGVEAAIINEKGKVLPANQKGDLAIKPGWPSMMKTVWRRPKKYESYFRGDWYVSGDRAWKDEEGYFWFIGRADDVIKTAGERVGPFEVESALVEHPAIVEAGVIGKPDPIRGEIIKAFLVLHQDAQPTEKLKEEIKVFVKRFLAGHAYPREIEFVKDLPKTRSGKIMRRVLKAKELGQKIGDVSTLQ